MTVCVCDRNLKIYRRSPVAAAFKYRRLMPGGRTAFEMPFSRHSRYFCVCVCADIHRLTLKNPVISGLEEGRIFENAGLLRLYMLYLFNRKKHVHSPLKQEAQTINEKQMKC